MKLVVIESPYAGDVEKNLKYARRCMKDSLARGEAPYASHLLFTNGVLDDLDPEERKAGIEAGLAWGAKADLVAVYVDRGISTGMHLGIREHVRRSVPIELRGLDAEPPSIAYALLESIRSLVTTPAR